MTLSYRIEGGDYESAGLASRRLKEHLAKAGVGAPAMRRAMIAAYEAEMNVVIHARTGTLWARVEQGRLDLEVADEGPGIPDVELALREGWSTASERAREMGFGAGLGLPNIRRNSDLFEIETRVGRGTRIRSTILLVDAVEVGSPAAAPRESFPLGIDAVRCRQCMRCVPACPAAALRVRTAGPSLIEALCIGCTSCAAQCASGVYRIADGDGAPFLAPEPARDAVLIVQSGFLSGVPVVGGPAQVLAALGGLGFNKVRLLDEWTGALKAHARGSSGSRPLIAPFCPPAVALIESRFPSLIPQLGGWLSPAEAAGEEFPLRPVVLVASCPGQFAAVRRTSLTGRLTVLSPERLLRALRPLLAGHEGEKGGALVHLDHGAQSAAPGEMRVQGASHVMRVLAEAEAGRLDAVSLLDLSLCEGGCNGSPFLTDERFLSDRRWREYEAGAPRAPFTGTSAGAAGAVARARPFMQRAGVRLDPDMATAIGKLSRIDALVAALPGRDCGACGAPSCAAFAEDVVMERAGGESCPYVKEMR
jgi:anti-sigma regulatory factor (Ser/Thr protein kinase)/ferredoxin